jgi:hypothetical protein
MSNKNKEHSLNVMKVLLGSLVFRHQSSGWFETLEPITYQEVAKQRDNQEYMEDRIRDEKVYHDLLPGISNPDKSFLYATILGYHKMESPYSFPGYTYYFRLSLDQIQNTVFRVVTGEKSTKPIKGVKGLIIALWIWKSHSKKFKSYNDPLIGEIDPRIEVVISYPVKWFKYIPQVEDRKES